MKVNSMNPGTPAKTNRDLANNLMILPTLNCHAACSYCFGPHEGSPTMTLDTLEAVVRWQQQKSNGHKLEITFHGGEPLLPGISWYRKALPMLREGLAPREVRFNIQSNLWALNDDLCDLFQKYQVSLGTSLDGPADINDAQRGQGYFQRTMAGIERARSRGLNVGVICTFTPQSAAQSNLVFNFFLEKGLGFSIHPALPSLGDTNNGFVLSPGDHGQLLVDLLKKYLTNADKVRISSLDAMIRSISAGQGGICTFTDCLGHYLAVDPEGWIYPCQRMAGMEPFRLGNVQECPTHEDLERAPIWIAMQARQEKIDAICGDCAHLAYCRSGCPYNVLAANQGRLDGDPRDPHCPAYRRIFDEITNQALEEVFSEENMDAVVSQKPGKYGLLRKGNLLQIMRDGPHPQDVARQARQTVAAAALGVCATPEEALEKLMQSGVVSNPGAALGSLRGLRQQLDKQSQQGLVNAYLHVTEACNLACRHCYAVSKKPENAISMAVEDILSLGYQAAEAGFKKLVITGGEPLMHPQRDDLLDALAAFHRENKPMKIALRTNLAYGLTEELSQKLFSAADEIVVSVDGNQNSHDAQRGEGVYNRVVANLSQLSARQADFPGKIVIAAALTNAQMTGAEGEAVRVLGEKLGFGMRFKPILPLGRGRNLDVQLSYNSSLDEDVDRLAYGSRPVSTCGLGMNLYIGADGTCYPCYALMHPRHHLGNALHEGLMQVLSRNDAYRAITVDSNRKCRDCELRYLCGGFCRAWSEGDDPDAPLPDCTVLYQRAAVMLRIALEVLDIPENRWKGAGLPLADLLILEN
jgi:uncharacterized protein